MKHNRSKAKAVDDWTRFEVEYKGHYAHELTKAIRQCKTDNELKNLILSSILDKYMFFHVNSNRPHRITRLMINLLDDKKFEFPPQNPKDDTVKRSIDYMKKGSGLYPLLYKVNQVWGDGSDSELIQYLFFDYKKEFLPNKDHEAWVTKYKNYLQRFPVPWEDD
ncbi:replication initiation factor domain-containing protein [Streptococcus thoraltensis]|uniref:replication initiation factor domain-containing protein n=1 Tax=Streptococcus thoraltensis TaxID=55085 RepID=UPI00039DF2ED|nr:replication initiation factor domain-containing protein [Streptococcus thoraltensis]